MEKVKAGFEKFFRIKERNTTIPRELFGGLTIFLAMVYILPVNSFMLGIIPGSTVGAIFAATAISAAAATLLMGLFANFPVALAPGMGVNAFFTYTVCLGALNFTYSEALACTLISGIIFVIISLTSLRTIVLKAIPKNLKIAVGAGIGFFICFIGLKNAGIITSNPSTFVSVGDLSQGVVLLGLAGIVIVLVLSRMKKIKNFAVIISMVVIALVGGILSLCGVANMPTFSGTSIGSVGDISTTFGAAFTGFKTVFARPEAYAVIFSFLFVDFFDTAGTLVAVGTEANLVNEKGEISDSKKALLADSVGTVVGAVLGTSTVTSYVESTTGISGGARTGLSACTVGVLFLLSLFAYPVLGIFDSVMIEGVAFSPVTSLALFYVGTLMFQQLKDMDWKDGVAVASCFIVLIFMILGYSISNGILFGFLGYVLLMIASGRHKEVSPVMYGLSVLFIIDLVVEHFIL